MAKAAPNMYLVTFIDGGFDSLYYLLNEKEWLKLVDDPDCENDVFGPFYEDNTKESKRVFYKVTEVFDYLKKHEMVLADDCTIIAT